MLHAKLFMRCLAWGPWLLAVGLVLGWSGEAEAQTDLKLSVNPNSVREDAGATAITVTVEVTDDTAVDADTYVLLSVSSQGLNSRFNIRLTDLVIPAGKKKATGTFTIIPIDDESADEDLSIEISGNAGSKTVKPTTITLIDNDKASKKISLSADIVELNRFDGATKIAVTATLDGKALNSATSFALTIGDHPDLDSPIDDAGATADNREAQRDLDYTVTLATITIPRNAVSGTATITVTPSRRGLPGTIRLGVPDRDADTEGIQLAVGGLTVSPVDIKIKKEAAATADTVTLSQESIRESAGETTIELKVTLTSALIKDEVMRLVLLSDGAALPSGGTVSGTPTRDIHYTLAFGPPVTIPAGATEATTKFTLTPRNDTEAVTRGSIYIQVMIGSVSVVKTIAIADDDANSTKISLEVAPTAISEGSGSTDVVVTGTLNGRALGDDLVVLLTIDPDPKDTDAKGKVVDVVEATRDIDYRAVLRSLRIPAGALSGTATITITPVDDNVVDSGEKIRLTVPNKQISARSAEGDVLQLTVGTVDITLKDGEDSASDGGEDSAPSFALGASIADQAYTVGVAIASLVLPAATGGDGSPTYSVSALPAGLVFDPSTRTLSGAPTAATNGAVVVTYTATDSDGDAAELTFTVAATAATAATAEDGAMLAFASGASIADQAYTVGVAIASLVLPAPTGADCALTYSVSALPAGLVFDPSTRTLSGTPTAATDGAVVVTYTATDNDEEKESVELAFTITVNSALSFGEISRVMAAGLTAEPAVVLENAGATAISLTFTLASASLTNEAVLFSIVEPSNGPAAVRDVDYTAELEALIIIPAGTTETTTTLTLTPTNDNNEGPKALGVQALLVSTGEILVKDIEIAAAAASSKSITLSASPSTLSEQDDLTAIRVTATLNEALGSDATVHLAIDDASTATRNLDYVTLFTPSLEIPAGSITGTMRLYVDPVADDLEEGDEVIRLIGTIDGLTGDEVEITISESAAAKAVIQTRPAAFELANNYPNPFNPTTTIRYALPLSSDVELTVYNMVGQAVRTLVSEHQSAGRYSVEWDATNDSGHRLSSGLYFYHLQVGGQFHDIKRMLLLK